MLRTPRWSNFGLRRYSHFSPFSVLGLDVEALQGILKCIGNARSAGTKPARIMPTEAASKISIVVAPALIAGSRG